MNPRDEEMLDCLRSGDERRYGRLVVRLQEAACLYAKSIVLQTASAHEIVNDVFLKLWTSRDQLTITSSFRAYLFRMIHNHCCDYLRSTKRSANLNFISIEDMKLRLEIFEIADTDTGFNNLYSEQVETNLAREIGRLPEQCREIFILSRFEQLSYPEIATKLNLSLSTVKTQMVRAMVKLKDAMKDFI
jgi:RNA polymerase sigma-70 factor (ECF subfamily)